ncbi:MAG: acyl carrier protein [bacterium]
MNKKSLNERVETIVFSVIDEINQQLTKTKQLKKTKDTVLFGKLGVLDSLGLVNLIVAIEQRIEEEFGITITLADEKAMSQKNSPFRTVKTIMDYVFTLLEGKIQ